MGLNSQDHLFFVQEIEEIDLCDNKIYQLTGSDYSKPTDFTRLDYKEHNLKTCESCRNLHTRVFSEIVERFKNFPNCCAFHKNLQKEKWFDRKDFENIPRLHADKLIFTWHHILNFVETDEWELEILDFIEYIFQTFGSFPIDYGEPLYFRTFTEQLESLISGLTDIEPKKKVILSYIHNFRNPDETKKTDWNILVKTYNDWYKTFPFELSYFSHLKEQFAKNIPLFEKFHTNKYLNLTKATPRTKVSLVNSLVEVTDKIISQINTVTLYENGSLNDIEKVKLELLIQKRKQKLKEGYSNKSNDPDTRYRRILKEWLKDEVNFIKEIEPTLKSISDKKSNLYTDILNACYTMQENKIFWNADENTRTKQILDLLSANYFTKDQPLYGKSETGKKQGSVDGVIIDNAKTEHFIEALNLGSLNKEIIQRHINKVESNYDSKGLLNKFILVYCNVQDNKFDKLYSSYLKFIDSELEYKFQKTGTTEKETRYTNIKVLKSLHLRENREVTLYHILIKMPTE